MPFGIWMKAPAGIFMTQSPCESTLVPVRCAYVLVRGGRGGRDDVRVGRPRSGANAGREQEREVHAVNCDHIILRVVPDRQVKYSTISDQ